MTTITGYFCRIVPQHLRSSAVQGLSQAARPPLARVAHAKATQSPNVCQSTLPCDTGERFGRGAASPHFHLNNPAAADAFCLAKCAGRAIGPDLAPKTPVKEHCPLTIPNVCQPSRVHLFRLKFLVKVFSKTLRGLGRCPKVLKPSRLIARRFRLLGGPAARCG